MVVSVVKGGSGGRVIASFFLENLLKGCRRRVARRRRSDSSRFASGDKGKVDVGLGDFVYVVRPRIKRNVEHDLDYLSVVIASSLNRIEISFGDMAALTRDLDREANGGICLRIVRRAVAVCSDLGIVKLGEILAQIGVGREAIVTTIDLGDSQGDALPRRRRQSTFAQ